MLPYYRRVCDCVSTHRPEVSSEVAAEVSERLKRDLAGIFVTTRPKSSSRRAKIVEKTAKRGKLARGEAERIGSEGLLVLRKKPDSGDDLTASPSDTEKKRLIVIGVNAVTRQLERDGLRAGLVCLSAKPGLLTQHIMMLAATRGCPVLALPDMSSTVAPVMGLKSVLAIGFKTVEGDDDPFRELVALLVARAPLIQIPWLTVAMETTTQVSGENQDGCCVPLSVAKRQRSDSECCYASLQIKTTIKKRKQRHS